MCVWVLAVVFVVGGRAGQGEAEGGGEGTGVDM